MRIILIGQAGSGKGTQAERLVRLLRIPHISSGELLRDAAQRRTPEGIQAEGFMSRGELVPDSLILDLIGQRLDQPDAEAGYLLDGFPRTLAQAEALDERLRQRNIPLHAVVELHVPIDELVRRLLARMRSDDRPEVFQQRFANFERQTQPLLDYYRRQGLLHSVDGAGDPEEIFKRIEAALAHAPQRK
jgi:adenylate kinase